jgi:signal transduction histidine kinase
MSHRPNLDLLRRFYERESLEKVLSRQKQKPFFRCFLVLVALSYFRSGILTRKDGLRVVLRGLLDRREYSRAKDLSYLAAFGNSIMAEVARLDTIAADRAKSDFISSISHELRSPLHGILTSVEFLQDIAVDLF